MLIFNLNLNNYLEFKLNFAFQFFRLTVTPDSKFKKELIDPSQGCIVGLGSLESSFFIQTTSSISSYDDPDLPALMLYLQYLIQTEVRIAALNYRLLLKKSLFFRDQCGNKSEEKVILTIIECY